MTFEHSNHIFLQSDGGQEEAWVGGWLNTKYSGNKMLTTTCFVKLFTQHIKVADHDYTFLPKWPFLHPVLPYSFNDFISKLSKNGKKCIFLP